MPTNSSQPRRRKLIRAIVLCLVGPPVLLLAVRLLWGVEATHRIAAVNADLRARGIRLDPPHVQIPDGQNAALPIIQAIYAINLTSSEVDIMTEGDAQESFAEITWTDAHLPQVRAILARNEPAFQLVREAETRPSAVWPTDDSAASPRSISLYGRQRSLANLLFDASRIAHLDHREADALQYLRLILVLARDVGVKPNEISQLVSLAISAVAAQGAERMAPELHLDETDGSAEAARRLLPLFQEASLHLDPWPIAFERDIGRTALRPEPGMQPFWQWWFSPLYLDETARAMQLRGEQVPSVRADNWQDANRLYPQPLTDITTLLQASTLLASYDDAGISLLACKLEFRLARPAAPPAMLLAAALYNAQFSHMPLNAREFVPNFLSVLPIDPFAADHRPMAYRLDPAGPTVWSVGENGTDEGGHVFFDADGNRRTRYGGSSNPKENPPDLIFGAAWTASPEKISPVHTPAPPTTGK